MRACGCRKQECQDKTNTLSFASIVLKQCSCQGFSLPLVTLGRGHGEVCEADLLRDTFVAKYLGDKAGVQQLNDWVHELLVGLFALFAPKYLVDEPLLHCQLACCS